MDKGLGPPPTLHDLQMDKGLGPPPNPSRLANGQRLRAAQPFMTWGRPPNGPGLGPPPQPFTTCKWTRVGGPATLHDLGAASKWTSPICKWTGVGAQPFTTPPQPSTTCRWTTVGGPNPSRLANGQGLGAPQPFTTCKPQILFAQALGPPNHRTLEHISQGTGSVSTDRNINDKPFVPECTLEQVLNFA